MGTSANYPKVPYQVGQDTSVLQSDRVSDKTVGVRRNLPGNVIVIHGVNDVGVSFSSVEQGLCEGLSKRLKRDLAPAEYSLPQPEDKNKLYDDPDAVFFKRRIDRNTDSPVIPFYWGYAEDPEEAKTNRGQYIDRYGNRLDKDLSKGGGPFSNATNTLPDMWNRGFSALPRDALDSATADPLRPVLKAPGRMYMVLAAQRLAALIAMIRDYAPEDAVSIVAHSQGCLVSLLAQAFLLEKNLRPADTLVMTHPPYSLVDDVPFYIDMAEAFRGGEDPAMKKGYDWLKGRQTFHARLQTMINIVDGVLKEKNAVPAIPSIADQGQHFGMVGSQWKAEKDRDNRGKVYLYFCPEDMTVALDSMQGIGWQGVPNEMEGKKVCVPKVYNSRGEIASTEPTPILETITRFPLKELGAGFFQRVFTAKRRPDPKYGKPVLVGALSPYDFMLRHWHEDDHAHVADGAATLRARLDNTHMQAREIRKITGETLETPVAADMYAGATKSDGELPGAYEEVDPIDAAIATTSNHGLQETYWLLMDEPLERPFGSQVHPVQKKDYGWRSSPRPDLYKGYVTESPYKIADVKAALNQGKPPGQCCEIVHVFTGVKGYGSLIPTGKVLVKRMETPDEARVRWQNSTSARSFHGAIFGSRANHANVTAYDVAIGGGKASSHPGFYAYLCAVADWRITMNKNTKRPNILKWAEFEKKFDTYWKVEPQWRKDLIQGNANYYSKGELPGCLPTLPNGLPPAVVSETTIGRKIGPMGDKKG